MSLVALIIAAVVILAVLGWDAGKIGSILVPVATAAATTAWCRSRSVRGRVPATPAFSELREARISGGRPRTSASSVSPRETPWLHDHEPGDEQDKDGAVDGQAATATTCRLQLQSQGRAIVPLVVPP